jgi:hypothetical protein
MYGFTARRICPVVKTAVRTAPACLRRAPGLAASPGMCWKCDWVEQRRYARARLVKQGRRMHTAADTALRLHRACTAPAPRLHRALHRARHRAGTAPAGCAASAASHDAPRLTVTPPYQITVASLLLEGIWSAPWSGSSCWSTAGTWRVAGDASRNDARERRSRRVEQGVPAYVRDGAGTSPAPERVSGCETHSLRHPGRT